MGARTPLAKGGVEILKRLPLYKGSFAEHPTAAAGYDRKELGKVGDGRNWPCSAGRWAAGQGAAPALSPRGGRTA